MNTTIKIVAVSAFFVFCSATVSAQTYSSKVSYDESDVNIYSHSFDQGTEKQFGNAKLQDMRDRRLQNLVTDEDDYKLDSDVTPKKHKNSSKHKSNAQASQDQDNS